jgi:alkylhydroperoxidase family enzyme
MRGHVALVGYLGTKPESARTSGQRGTPSLGASTDFLSPAPDSPEAQKFYDGDLSGMGYVMNSSRLWAHLPSALTMLSDLLGEVTRAGTLTHEQRSVLVTAAASSLGDSYCSLAWGQKLADAAGPDVAAALISGEAGSLARADQALARWARLVVTDPNAITADDVQALRDAGFDDAQIFAITVFVALRLAFSTVNDALGARPDHRLAASVSEIVRDAVSFGRPAGEPQA